MEVRRFLPTDLMLIALQPRQRSVQAEAVTPEYAAALAAHGPCFTAYDGERIVGCIGLVEQWPGCARAYAFLSQDAGPYMVGLTWRIRDWLRANPIRRIEATVESTFDAGHRWVKRLGFKYEGHMTAYWNERDADLYARILMEG